MSANSENRESKLKFYSLGIVVNDKPRGTDDIDVYPVEDLPMINGKIKDYKPNYQINLPNAKRATVSSNVKGSAVMSKVKWIPFSNSNRMSSPDVIKNETVIIWRFSDTEEYYWSTIFREPSIRRLETVLYAYGNLRAPLVPWDKKTSYWMEVSTHDKHIRLHTSKSDGEPFEYDVTINTKVGYVEIKDDVGNFMKLDSRGGVITHKATKEVLLEAPTVRFKANHVINQTPLVTNTGKEETAGTSSANPHTNCVH